MNSMNSTKITKLEKLQYIEQYICKNPHIGNIIQWLNDNKLCMDYCFNYWQTTYSENLIRTWKNFDEILNKQPASCINFVYETIYKQYNQ